MVLIVRLASVGAWLGTVVVVVVVVPVSEASRPADVGRSPAGGRVEAGGRGAGRRRCRCCR